MYHVIRNFSFAFTLLMTLCACGEAEDAAESPIPEPPKVSSADTPSSTVDNIKGDPSEIVIDGGITFSINGDAKKLNHIPAGRAFYYTMALQVTFHAKQNSTESLMLNIMGADLKALNYPITLPEERDPNDPLTITNRGATVGWAYMNADGVEWTTGTAKLTLESLSRDGVLKGSFGETSLRGAGQKNIVLDDGKFTVQLSLPW